MTERNRPQNFSCQYEPQHLSEKDVSKLLTAPDLLELLDNSITRFEKALLYNDIMDVFEDDYNLLGDEDLTVEQSPQTALLVFH